LRFAAAADDERDSRDDRGDQDRDRGDEQPRASPAGDGLQRNRHWNRDRHRGLALGRTRGKRCLALRRCLCELGPALARSRCHRSRCHHRRRHHRRRHHRRCQRVPRLGGENGAVGPSVSRVLGHRPLHDRPDVGRHIRRQRRRLVVDMSHRDVNRIVPRERQMAGQAPVGHDAERVDV